MLPPGWLDYTRSLDSRASRCGRGTPPTATRRRLRRRNKELPFRNNGDKGGAPWLLCSVSYNTHQARSQQTKEYDVRPRTDARRLAQGRIDSHAPRLPSCVTF